MKMIQPSRNQLAGDSRRGSALFPAVPIWPGERCSGEFGSTLALTLTYSLLATLYLAYVGIEGQWIGKLLWPAVVVHGILTVLLARAWFMDLTMPTKTTRTEETTSDE